MPLIAVKAALAEERGGVKRGYIGSGLAVVGG